MGGIQAGRAGGQEGEVGCRQAVKCTNLRHRENVCPVHALHMPCAPLSGIYLEKPSNGVPSPPPLSFPTPGKTVPHHPLGDGHQATPPPPRGGPHHHRTRTFAGTEIAA